jgi:hypothetical protein
MKRPPKVICVVIAVDDSVVAAVVGACWIIMITTPGTIPYKSNFEFLGSTECTGATGTARDTSLSPAISCELQVS